MSECTHNTAEHLAEAETMLQDGYCPQCMANRIAALESERDEAVAGRRKDNREWLAWSESKGPGLDAYREQGEQILAQTTRAEAAERERDEAIQRHEQLQREVESAIASLVKERDEAIAGRREAVARERQWFVDNVALYGDDTMSGPEFEPAQVIWYREGIRDMLSRIRARAEAPAQSHADSEAKP